MPSNLFVTVYNYEVLCDRVIRSEKDPSKLTNINLLGYDFELTLIKTNSTSGDCLYEVTNEGIYLTNLWHTDSIVLKPEELKKLQLLIKRKRA